MECTHHWQITNNGTIAKGTCRKCGEVREFDNRLGDGFNVAISENSNPPRFNRKENQAVYEAM